jgi:hypothetical protein
MMKVKVSQKGKHKIIVPCGKVHSNIATENKKEHICYIPQLAWRVHAVGTNTYHTASNNDVEVEIVEGCFSTYFVVSKKGCKSERVRTFPRASLKELQVKVEKEYLGM